MDESEYFSKVWSDFGKDHFLDILAHHHDHDRFSAAAITENFVFGSIHVNQHCEKSFRGSHSKLWENEFHIIGKLRQKYHVEIQLLNIIE